MKILEIKDVSKTFGNIKALKNVSFNVREYEMVGLIGPSGSGKSTLLRLISGLMKTDGRASLISVFNETVQKRGIISKNIRKIRSRIGFIFQKFNLVERLNLMTNVLVGHLAKMPFYRSWFGLFSKNERIKAIEALHRVKMLPWANQRAKNLSGGQQQRAAIARTLVQNAEIILADEPIASLDPESSKRVMKLLSKINKEDKVTVLVTLHQVDYAFKYCDRIIALKSGEIIFDGRPEDMTNKTLHKIYGDKFSETGIEEDDFDFKDNMKRKIIEQENIAKVKSVI